MAAANSFARPALMAPPPVYGHDDVRRKLSAALRAGTSRSRCSCTAPRAWARSGWGSGSRSSSSASRPRRRGTRAASASRAASWSGWSTPTSTGSSPFPAPTRPTPEKLREKLEEARFAELTARRADPFHVPAFDKAPAYFMGMVQNLQRLAGVRPAMGSRKVFVVGDAEAMVPQESSPEAANAFLKLLEEPPADTTLILHVVQPRRAAADHPLARPPRARAAAGARARCRSSWSGRRG